MEGMENKGVGLFWGEELLFCFFRLSPKRVYVGGSTAGGRASDAAADRDESMSLVLNESNRCCLLAVLDFTDANASAVEKRREKHVATASATLTTTFLLLRWQRRTLLMMLLRLISFVCIICLPLPLSIGHKRYDDRRRGTPFR